MKYKNIIILVVLSFFILNISVQAEENLETYKQELDAKFQDKSIVISKNENLCIYHLSEYNLEMNQFFGGYYYIAISYQDANISATGNNINFLWPNTSINPYLIYSVPSYTKVDSCSSLYVYGTETNIMVGTSKDEYDNYDIRYEYDKAVTEQYQNNISKTATKFSSCGVYDKKNNSYVYLGSYHNEIGDDTQNYFLSSNNSYYICPVKYDETTVEVERIFVDIEKFQCKDWQIVFNNGYVHHGSDPCQYYLVDKDTKTRGDTGQQLEEEGDVITTYKQYNNLNAPAILIMKKADEFQAASKSGEKIDVMSSDFIKENIDGKEKYPKYLLKLTNGTYEFSETKKEDAVEVYINIDSLMEFNLNGTDIKATCNDLIGNDLIKLVNNNVLKIVYIAVPIILILLTSFDFAKVVFIDDKEGIQKAGKKFLKRVIVSVFIYLIPQILILVINTIGAKDVDQCIKQLNQMQQEISEES